MDKIRVGVVGVGYLGQYHAEKYARMEGVELVGVADIDSHRAKEVAKRYRTQPFSHHAQLLSRVQAVSIAVPTRSHHLIAKDFFLQGVDVLLEKPISYTLREADELVQLAESKGLIFQVGHLERFNAAYSASEEFIRSPLFIESHRLSPFPGRGTDVNVVLDLMIHDIDILLSWVKSKVMRIEAVGISVLTPSSDIANARIEFENGCIANMTASRVSREKIRRTRIYQPDGTLSIDYLLQKVSLSKRLEPSAEDKIPEIATEEIVVKKFDSLEAEIHAFLQSVRNRNPARVSGRDGRQALEMALEIIQKIEERPSKQRMG